LVYVKNEPFGRSKPYSTYTGAIAILRYRLSEKGLNVSMVLQLYGHRS